MKLILVAMPAFVAFAISWVTDKMFDAKLDFISSPSIATSNHLHLTEVILVVFCMLLGLSVGLAYINLEISNATNRK